MNVFMFRPNCTSLCTCKGCMNKDGDSEGENEYDNGDTDDGDIDDGDTDDSEMSEEIKHDTDEQLIGEDNIFHCSMRREFIWEHLIAMGKRIFKFEPIPITHIYLVPGV